MNFAGIKSMSIKTTYHKVKDWNHRLEKRMKQPAAIPEVNHEHHICQHCSYGFDGRYCPQCGMPATHSRFTFRRLTNNFLDIWGFGNRPMFRTIGNLLWRPGYMIRDYLAGHHLSYFPPFKMLAVFTIVILFLAWVFGFEDPLAAKDMAQFLQQFPKTGKFSSYALDQICRGIIYLDKYDLYRILLQNVFVVPAAWLVFRKKGLNLVETFFSQIYINCQMHMMAIVWMLLTWDLPPTFLLPYYVPGAVAFIILIFDYKQLYELSFKQSLWRTLLFILLVLLIYLVVLALALMVIYSVDGIMGQ